MAVCVEDAHARIVRDISPFFFPPGATRRLIRRARRDDVDQLRSAMRGQQGRGLWLFGKETGVAVVRTLPDDTIEASFRGARGLMKCFESVSVMNVWESSDNYGETDGRRGAMIRLHQSSNSCTHSPTLENTIILAIIRFAAHPTL